MYNILLMDQWNSMGITVSKYTMEDGPSVFLFRLKAEGEEALSSLKDYDIIFTNTCMMEKKWIELVKRIKTQRVCAMIMDSAYQCLDAVESISLERIEKQRITSGEGKHLNKQLESILYKYWNRECHASLKEREQKRIYHMFMKEDEQAIPRLGELLDHYLERNQGKSQDAAAELTEFMKEMWKEICQKAIWVSYIERFDPVISPEKIEQDVLGAAEYMRNMIQKYEINRPTSMVNRICRVMNTNIAEENVMDLVLKEVDLSRDYIGRILKKKLGMSLLDFLTLLKMEHAKRLLRESNQKIYEIGESLGYSTADYFSKLFREYTGMTPGQYRKKK